MSEQVNSQSKEWFTCPECKAILGEVQEYNGITLVRVGSVPVREMRGFCPRCGTAFHWCVSDRMLERLIKKVVENERG